MTKPREKTREELTAEIEDGKKKIRQFENREKMLRQKLSKEERRTRSQGMMIQTAQKKLAEFESLVDPMYRAMQENNIQSSRLSELRDALLPKLMSGEIDVSDIQL